jgi:hypothetical protein
MAQPETITELRSRRDAALTSAIAADEHVRALDAAIARAERAGQGDEARRLVQQRAAAERAQQAARVSPTRRCRAWSTGCASHRRTRS